MSIQPNPDLCPKNVVESFLNYRDDGVPPGDFIRACLENNLMEAHKRADATNLEVLPHIVAWLYWNMDVDLIGSPERVNAHLVAMREPPERERDEPVLYGRGELPPRDARDEHDRSL